MNEIVGVFRNLGYSGEEGPEKMERAYYNFEAVNFLAEPSGGRTRRTRSSSRHGIKKTGRRETRPAAAHAHLSSAEFGTMPKRTESRRCVLCVRGKFIRNRCSRDVTHSPCFIRSRVGQVDTKTNHVLRSEGTLAFTARKMSSDRV